VPSASAFGVRGSNGRQPSSPAATHRALVTPPVRSSRCARVMALLRCRRVAEVPAIAAVAGVPGWRASSFVLPDAVRRRVPAPADSGIVFAGRRCPCRDDQAATGRGAPPARTDMPEVMTRYGALATSGHYRATNSRRDPAATHRRSADCHQRQRPHEGFPEGADTGTHATGSWRNGPRRRSRPASGRAGRIGAAMAGRLLLLTGSWVVHVRELGGARALASCMAAKAWRRATASSRGRA
jgi:hypothetical protein